MLINLFNKNNAKIMLFLALSPGSKYSRKEIKEKTELNNMPLDNSLNILLNLNVINEQKKLYYLNLENPFVQLILKEKTKMSNLPLKIQFLLLDFVEHILRLKLINEIILFGSYAKLIFSEKSDIDIAIVLDDKSRNKEKIGKKISAFEKKLSKKYKKDIQIHFFIESDLKHKKDPLIKDILKNGRGLLENKNEY